MATTHRLGRRARPTLDELGHPRWAFDAIGVPWTVDTAEPLHEPTRRQVLGLIASFDATWSRFRSDSLVTRIARAELGGRFVLPAEHTDLLDLYDELHRLTAGAVDPLVGRQLEHLGYDASYRLTPRAEEASAGASWAGDVGREGHVIETTGPLLIDVGAVGKGYLVDLVSDLLTDAGLYEHVVDASGDLRHRGAGSTRVGLQHPTVETSVIGTVAVHDQALCASGVARRAWRGLHHVLDARTGRPTDDVIATWALAPTAALADGLATALFFTDPATLAETFDAELVRVRRDLQVEVSPSWPGELFVPDGHLQPLARRKPHHTKRRRRNAAALAGLALTLVIAGCSDEDQPASRPPSDAEPTSTAPSSTTATRATRYQDGSYTADGWYGGQPSRIGVRLSLQGDTIQSVEITSYATDPTSLDFQQRFSDAVPAAVIGRPIDDADVDRLAGASGTSEGWNAALEIIRDQAAA